MDTSETYIKLCEKATEIQGIKAKPTLMVWDTTPLYIDPDGDWYAQNGLWANGVRVLWLPRQDQLQRILGTDFLNTLHRLHEWSISGWVWGNGYPQVYTSMEQLWLGFLMKEKYKKTWNGTDWVPTKVNAGTT
jgi:hypothetical protein